MSAVDGFGLGDPIEVEPLPDGHMNHNWRVRTATGCYAVKQCVDVHADAARWHHTLMNALADKGFPVPRPVVAPDGRTVLEQAAGTFTVQPWIEGGLRAGCALGVDEAGRLGEFLGRLHLGLADLRPAPDPLEPAPMRDPVAAHAKAEDYIALIDGLPAPTRFDWFARSALREKQRLLDEWGHDEPAAEPVGPSAWAHGDFQDLNLIWRNGDVVGVIDWDRTRVQPIADELVRSAVLMFWDEDGEFMDLPRISAYVAGYRAVVPVTDEQLDDAQHRRWWEKLCGFWPLSDHYDKGNSTCDHLFVEETARLPWWCARRGDVRQAFLAR